MRRRRRDEDETGRVTLAPGMLAVPNVTLTRKIAEGGMGSVWEGQHLALRTTVAVKFVLAELGENEEAVQRFEREATSAAQIKSPHVVQVLDHGLTEHEGVPYIVMELLEGEDLEARLAREPRLPLELVAHLVAQASKALTRAHSLGIVHRDIKPSNVFLTDVGGETFVKLLDFGIAKSMENEVGRARVTQTGAMLGTPIFMSPEQMTHAKDVGPGADMWSLGVVAYLALLGRLPFDEDTIAGIAMAIERGVFPPPTSLMPDLPEAVDEWFATIFKKDPKARFGSAKDMADALSRIAQMPISPASVAHNSSPPQARASDRPASALDEERSVEDEPTHVEDAGSLEQRLAESFGIDVEPATEVGRAVPNRGPARPSIAKPKAAPPVAKGSTIDSQNKAAGPPSLITNDEDDEEDATLPAVGPAKSRAIAAAIAKTHSIAHDADDEASEPRRVPSDAPTERPDPPVSSPPPPIFDASSTRSDHPPTEGPATVMGVSGGDVELPTGKRSRGRLFLGAAIVLAAASAGTYAFMHTNDRQPAIDAAASSSPIEPPAPSASSVSHPDEAASAISPTPPPSASVTSSASSTPSSATSAHPPPVAHPGPMPVRPTAPPAATASAATPPSATAKPVDSAASKPAPTVKASADPAKPSATP